LPGCQFKTVSGNKVLQALTLAGFGPFNSDCKAKHQPERVDLHLFALAGRKKIPRLHKPRDLTDAVSEVDLMDAHSLRARRILARKPQTISQSIEFYRNLRYTRVRVQAIAKYPGT